MSSSSHRLGSSFPRAVAAALVVAGPLGEDDPDAKRGGNEIVPPCYNVKSTLTSK